jgi:AcrR family transcriptional regulator
MNRGRPREFDTDEALDKALLVFWRKGYGGTSLIDLIAAMDVSGPSLYAAYGDKQSLFLRCVERYLNTYGAKPLRQLRETRHIREALHGFFHAIVNNVVGAKTPRGCLVVCGLSESAIENAAVGQLLTDCIRRTDAALKQRFARAFDDGELPATADPSQLAALTNSLRHGLALRARAGESRKVLMSLADGAVTLVLGAVEGL